MVPTVLDIPPNHGSTVAVWIVDHCVRGHRHPVGALAVAIDACIKARPISVVPDFFLGIDAIRLVATVCAALWGGGGGVEKKSDRKGHIEERGDIFFFLSWGGERGEKMREWGEMKGGGGGERVGGGGGGGGERWGDWCGGGGGGGGGRGGGGGVAGKNGGVFRRADRPQSWFVGRSVGGSPGQWLGLFL